MTLNTPSGCHGHHGQLPAGEYLVTTSAHTSGPDGQPHFLPWLQFLRLCLEFGLPLNDTWIIRGSSAAAAARQLLDDLAIGGCPTSEALWRLTAVVVGGDDIIGVTGVTGGTGDTSGTGSVEAQGMHLPGSYPHDQWQGSRIEGFVVSQGQALVGAEGGAAGAWGELARLGEAMGRQVVRVGGLAAGLLHPYQDFLKQSGEKASNSDSGQ